MGWSQRRWLSLLLACSASVLACADDEAPAGGLGGATGAAGAPGAAGVAGRAGGSGGPGGGGHGAGGGAKPKPTTISVGGDRFADLTIPSSYDGVDPLPLVVMLHGYGATGPLEEAYLGFRPLAEKLGFFYVAPDGTVDANGNRFWNATKACCDLNGVGVDDDAYLMSLLDEIEGLVHVDPKRVYFFGHSNGGFMTYRLACNHADRIAAVGVLAGAMVLDPTACQPSEPVSVLHIHGTADKTILFGGGSIAVEAVDKEAYPGALECVDRWRATDGCGALPPIDSSEDFLAILPGAETELRTYGPCENQTHVALWSMVGGSHIPSFNARFLPAVTSFLLSQAKP
jgi:polyhydroxybutyrate depolymerase